MDNGTQNNIETPLLVVVVVVVVVDVDVVVVVVVVVCKKGSCMRPCYRSAWCSRTLHGPYPPYGSHLRAAHPASAPYVDIMISIAMLQTCAWGHNVLTAVFT
jgi:hypothetical protein